MKKAVSVVELLAAINNYKQNGKSLEEIVEIMKAEGLHEDNTKELYSMLK